MLLKTEGRMERQTDQIELGFNTVKERLTLVKIKVNNARDGRTYEQTKGRTDDGNNKNSNFGSKELSS